MGNVKIPQMGWLRWVTAVFTLYAFIWIALEGAMWAVTLIAVGTLLVCAGSLVQRWLSGRVVAGWLFVGGTAVIGALFGLTLNLLVLFFMALKTGLHAHGPEFTQAEVNWVVAQRPLWVTVGYIAGLGIALIVVAFQQDK